MKPIEEILNNPRVDETTLEWLSGIGMPVWVKMFTVNVKLPGCGWCSVVAGNFEEPCWEHVSVSPYVSKNTPNWDDMCIIKDIFWDEEDEVLQIHPAKSEYVNIKSNCLHLWKVKGMKSLTRYAEEEAKRGKLNGRS